MTKPEPLRHFIARMSGREFTAGDVETNCQIPADDVADALAPWVRNGRITRGSRLIVRSAGAEKTANDMTWIGIPQRGRT